MAVRVVCFEKSYLLPRCCRCRLLRCRPLQLFIDRLQGLVFCARGGCLVIVAVISIQEDEYNGNGVRFVRGMSFASASHSGKPLVICSLC